MNELKIAYSGCPLCKSETQMMGTANCTAYPNWHESLPASLEWMRCTSCGHVHTSHYWSEAGLAEVFRHAHAGQLAGVGPSPDAKRAVWAPVVERAISLIGGVASLFGGSKTPVWLDVGCGDGALTMTAADYGFASLGLDARAETVSRIRQLGFNAQLGDFMKMGVEGQTHILSMMDVLEHMPYPRAALEKAAKIIAPGGVIVISVPDMGSSSWRMMDAAKANPYWIEIEHHHNFSRQSLVRLLKECGFIPSDFAVPFRYKAQMEIYAIKK
jgi:SAM-dependent methyltransferase